MGCLVCLNLMLGLLCVGDAQQDAVSKDRAAIQGMWAMVSTETEGITHSGEALSVYKIVFVGTQFLGAFHSGPASGTFELDVQPAVRAIDLHLSDGSFKGKIQAGIYQLEDDSLKICLNRPGKERPNEFTTAPPSGYEIITFKRVKPPAAQ